MGEPASSAGPEVGAMESKWLSFALLLIAQVFAIYDLDVTAVEVPAIIRTLGISHATAELTLTLTMAVAGALIVPMGQIADRMGSERLFLSCCKGDG